MDHIWHLAEVAEQVGKELMETHSEEATVALGCVFQVLAARLAEAEAVAQTVAAQVTV